MELKRNSSFECSVPFWQSHEIIQRFFFSLGLGLDHFMIISRDRIGDCGQISGKCKNG